MIQLKSGNRLIPQNKKGDKIMKKHTTRTLALSALLCAALCATACGKNGENSAGESNQDTTEWYDVSRENMDEEETTEAEETKATTTEAVTETTEETTEPVTDADGNPVEQDSGSGGGNKKTSRTGDGTTEEEYYQDEDAPAEVISPDVTIYGEKNEPTAMGLEFVTINGVRVDIRKETVDSFIEKMELRQNKDCTFFNPYETEGFNDGIFWYGKGYGRYQNAADESQRFTGTHVFIEGLEGRYIASEVDPTVEDGYKIRSIYSSVGATKDDFSVEFIGGIKVGTAKSEVEKLLGGGGNVSGAFTYYADDSNALVIRYGEDDTITEIYLFNDFDYAPIEYLPAVTTPSKTENSEEGKTTETEPDVKEETGEDAPIDAPVSPVNPDVHEVKE